MRKVSFLLLAAVFAFMTGCGSSKPKDQIIGKWQAVEGDDKDSTLEFKTDGTLVIMAKRGDKSMTMNGKYKFLEEELVEVEIENPLAALIPDSPKTMTQKIKVKIDKDELTTTDEKGKVEKAKRVK